MRTSVGTSLVAPLKNMTDMDPSAAGRSAGDREAPDGSLPQFWRDQVDRWRVRDGWQFHDIGLPEPRQPHPMWAEWPICVWPFAGTLAYRSLANGSWLSPAPGAFLIAAASSWQVRRQRSQVRLCKIEWHARGLVLVRNDRRQKDILRLPVGGWLLPEVQGAIARSDGERLHRLRAVVMMTFCVVVDGLGAGEGGGSEGERRFWQACDWIREHLAEDCGRERLGSILECHPAHVSRLFRRHAGCGLSDWVRRQRVRAAGQLLREGDSDLAAIAGRCGFGSASYLIRCFRREHGCTPDRWRRRAAAGVS